VSAPKLLGKEPNWNTVTHRRQPYTSSKFFFPAKLSTIQAAKIPGGKVHEFNDGSLQVDQ